MSDTTPNDQDALAPYDAVLLLGYGGPNGPDDVLPFMRNATAGRGIPDERLREVAGHYDLFGGVSPFNARTRELAEALQGELVARGSAVPVVMGHRNWHPFLMDALADLDERGARRVAVVPTSAYRSYSSCRQYREDLALALDATHLGLEVDKIEQYALSEGFLVANADALVDAWASLGEPRGRRVVLFVTHSIPVAMDEASGPGPVEERYRSQHLRVADAVASRAAQRLGFVPEWELTFCSRSGPPHVPWLVPDVSDRLRELAADGVEEIVAVPIGFVSDHMEVVYDLDVVAAATASELSLRFARAATAGTHPAFVAGLVDSLIARAQVARDGGDAQACGYLCSENCCLSGRPGQSKPAACQA